MTNATEKRSRRGDRRRYSLLTNDVSEAWDSALCQRLTVAIDRDGRSRRDAHTCRARYAAKFVGDVPVRGSAIDGPAPLDVLRAAPTREQIDCTANDRAGELQHTDVLAF